MKKKSYERSAELLAVHDMYEYIKEKKLKRANRYTHNERWYISPIIDVCTKEQRQLNKELGLHKINKQHK